MTREEALAYAISQKAGLESALHRTPCGYGNWAVYSTVLDFINAAISALKGPTREQVEKVWKGCPECKPRCGLCAHIFEWDKYGKPDVCESCVDFSNFESDQQFCEVCGAPMTDEAVDMVMKRMEALYEET